MRYLLVPALLILACCTHSNADSRTASESSAPAQPTAKEQMKDGWQNIKEGGKDVGGAVATGAKKAGTAIHSVACPIAADVRRRVYYAKDSTGYEKMLSAEKSDVRECFASEAGARDKGYTLVR